MHVQPNRYRSCGWWTRSHCALEEWWRQQQSPEAQTALHYKTAGEGISTFLLHSKLPLVSSFHKKHFSCISYVEDHTLVCFSSCWLSVKLLLILRHHSTGLKQFERNKRSGCSNYNWEILKYTPNLDLTTFSLHRRLRQSENDSELRFSFLNTFWTAFLKGQKNNSNIKKH